MAVTCASPSAGMQGRPWYCLGWLYGVALPQARSAQISPAEVGAAEVGAAEVFPGKVLAGEVLPAVIGIGQGRRAAGG